MMRIELGLERPDEKATPRSALLVGGGYVLGGIFPLAPYAFVPNAYEALLWSIIVTAIALFAFGGFRARVLGTPIVIGAIQTWIIGAIAGRGIRPRTPRLRAHVNEEDLATSAGSSRTSWVSSNGPLTLAVLRLTVDHVRAMSGWWRRPHYG